MTNNVNINNNTSLNDIISELLKHNINDINLDDKEEDTSTPQTSSNNETIFNKLSSYLPIISNINLESFITDTYDQLYKIDNKITYKPTETTLSFYNLNNQFFDTITELSLKYNSIIRKDQQSSSSTTSTTPIDKTTRQLSKIYSSIYYLFYINLFKIILKCSKLEELHDLLEEYYIENDGDDSYGGNSDEEDLHERLRKSEQAEEEKESKIVEINDDEVKKEYDEKLDIYEDFENDGDGNGFNHDDFVSFVGNSGNDEMNWKSISNKLSNIIEPISYDHISDDSIWEDFSMLQDIEEITTLLTTNSDLMLQQLIPNFIYLLRDRMIHKPSDIPYILPLIFKILQINQPSSSSSSSSSTQSLLSPFQFKTILSILSSLTIIKATVEYTKITQHISKYIHQLLPYLVDRIAFWITIPNDQFKEINSKIEFESITNLIYFYSEYPLKEIDNGCWDTTLVHSGILSQYISLIVCKFKESPLNVLVVLDSLTKLSVKSALLSKFISKVPEFVQMLCMEDTESVILTNYNHYHIIWIFILNCLYNNINTPNDDVKNNRNIKEGTFESNDDNLTLFISNLEQYQQLFNISNNNKLDQFEILLDILIICKKQQHNNNIFTSNKIQNLISKFEKTIVSIKIKQQESNSDNNNNNNVKKSKSEKKSIDIFNSHLNSIRIKLKSLTINDKNK